MAEPTKKSPFARLDTSLLRSTRDLPPTAEATAPAAEPNQNASPAPRAPRQRKPRPVIANSADSTVASEQPIVQASKLASYPDEMIATVRKIVRTTGKEVSFVRLTPAEKAQLADIVYTFKKQGKKTSETEINRIAVNFLMEDYRVSGANSILVRVIDSLLA
jgi:predicted secreted protein